MASGFSPTEASIFIQIWVDTNALQNGSTKGVYLVDSNHNNGSSSEGTPSLEMSATTNAKICWSIAPINVSWDGTLSIQSFGDAGVWGADGPPQAAAGSSSGAWTGQVMDNGNDTYAITFNMEPSGGSGITTSVNPYLNVS